MGKSIDVCMHVTIYIYIYSYMRLKEYHIYLKNYS